MLLAAEEQAKALKARLLESTEVAARAILEETRAEGDRRIDGATRQAEAIATTVSEIENAEHALTDRARTFAAASKALRAELESFAATLSEGERRLGAGAGEHEPQLVTSGASEEVEEPDYGDLDADLAVEDEDVDLSAPASNVSEAEQELAEEGKSDYDYEYEADDDGPIDDDGDDGEDPGGDEDDRPTHERTQADSGLSSGHRRERVPIPPAEAYPDLLATESFTRLQDELSDVEKDVADVRAAVGHLNEFVDANLAAEDEDVDLSAPASYVPRQRTSLPKKGRAYFYDYEGDDDRSIDDDGDDGEDPRGDKDDRPTLEFERPHDLKEDVSPRGRKRGERSKPKRFFMGLEKTTDTAAHQPQDVLPVLGTVRYSRRDRLAAELGGALIGLGGTIALLRFVLLD